MVRSPMCVYVEHLVCPFILCYHLYMSTPYIGKLEGEDVEDLEKQQLLNAVYRDAIRTDSDNPFFYKCRQAESSYISQHFHQSDSDSEDNIQKLINIIVIYTLEHETISYTQGMTDILSPILYVMKHEADAYIAFATMVERIKRHFGQWCSGTLHKLQRFRHLCEILDPELYQSLTENMEEDAFVLFFGMVLIECRREFSFQDSFHLLETIWAGESCMKDSFPSNSDLSHAQWAGYMTYESPEVLQQVFEGSGVPYSAVPLPYNVSGSSGPSYQYSRNPSLISCSPSQPVQAFLRMRSEVESTPTCVTAVEVHSPCLSPSLVSPLSTERSSVSSASSLSPHDVGDTSAGVLSPSPSQPKPVPLQGNKITLTYRERTDTRVRSLSDSNLHSLPSQSDTRYLRSPLVSKSASPHCPTANNGVGPGDSLCNHKLDSYSFSRSESELYDSFSNSKMMAVVHPHSGKNNTEMADMSSISSGTVSANGNGISSLLSINSRRSCSALNGNFQEGTLEQGREAYLSESEDPEGAEGNLDYTVVNDGSCSCVSTLSPDSGLTGKVTSTCEGSSLMTCPKTTNGFVADHSNNMSKKNLSINDLPKKGSTGGSTRAVAPTDDMVKAEASVPLNFPDDDNCELDTGELYNQQGRGGGGGGDVGGGVVEHRGMITSVSNSIKNSILSHYGPTSATTFEDESKPARRRRLHSSPRRICGRVTPTEHSSNTTPVHYDNEIPSSARVTPVAFFDTMDKLAKSAPPNRGPLFPSRLSLRKTHLRGRGESERYLEKREVQIRFEDSAPEVVADEPTYRHANYQSEGSELEASIMSQLIFTDEGAPRVTREESLSIPFYECYSLFICLAILVQSRHEIMLGGADFYRLSEILNAQAGMQDLDQTLRVAHKLYKTYRKYQEACFRGSNREMDCWLDDIQ